MQYSNGNPKLKAVANYTGALGDGLLYSARTLAPTMLIQKQLTLINLEMVSYFP